MKSLNDIIAELQAARDELHLKLHLASKDAEDEWADLVRDWEAFLTVSEFDKSKEEVGEAARQLGLKMKDAYDRFKKAAD